MNRNEFFGILQKNNISARIICFDDNIKDEVFCLQKNYSTWEIFFRERGKKYDYAEFSNESDALTELLNRILKTYGKTP